MSKCGYGTYDGAQKRQKKNGENVRARSSSSETSLSEENMEIEKINNIFGVIPKEKNSIPKNKENSMPTTASTNPSTTTATQKVNYKERYVNSDKSPIFVTLEKQQICEILVGIDLIHRNIKDISEIIKIGRNTVRVRCNSLYIAN